MAKQNPKLFVVGAGPGDPDLITVKAIKAIGAANVILDYGSVKDVIGVITFDYGYVS